VRSQGAGKEGTLRTMPLKDDVWPKFLRENAVRLFELDAPR
jgi:hypothetical protein